MGMFDSITTVKSKPVICPNCGDKRTNFQTKSLDNLMDSYQEGNKRRRIKHFELDGYEKIGNFKLPKWKDTGKITYIKHPTYLKFYAYDWCKCERMVGQYFKFDTKGKLSRVGKPIVEGE